MKLGYILLWAVFFSPIGAVSLADSISTVISCSGASVLSTTVSGEKENYANSVMTTDRANVSRSIEMGPDISTSTQISGVSSFMVDEYADQIRGSDHQDGRCLFLNMVHPDLNYDQIAGMGLFSSGMYASSRRMTNASTRGMTDINGSGMILLKSQCIGVNRTEIGKTFAVGPMHLGEEVQFGGDYD